jgi:periplasmic divalent cation tolerance protein
MTDNLIVFITSGDPAEAAKIAHALVEKRLAACVNIVPQVRSIYRWEAKVVEDTTECLMMVKTSRAHFDAMMAEVQRLHTYQVPEIVAVPIIAGAENYLAWLAASLQQP